MVFFHLATDTEKGRKSAKRLTILVSSRPTKRAITYVKVEASPEMDNEAYPSHAPNKRVLAEEREAPLTARGDLHSQTQLDFWPKMSIVECRGGLPGASPGASTIPFAEYRKTSVICEKCLSRRTRWLFSRSKFAKWRRCFSCMNDLERLSIAIMTRTRE